MPTKLAGAVRRATRLHLEQAAPERREARGNASVRSAFERLWRCLTRTSIRLPTRAPMAERWKCWAVAVTVSFAKASPMDLRLRQDSSRDLLEELEEGWGPPPPPRAAVRTTTADASTDDVPDLASLDEGWLDDLFPDDDDDDDELEPELPDERLDPEAFALAKKAREERAARKKEKKRARAEAKRARQKIRVAAMRQKQKKKTKKTRPNSPAFRHTPAPPRNDVRNDKGHPKYAETDDDAHAEHVRELADAKAPASKAAPKASRAPRHAPSTVASVKLLAIVLATLLVLAAAVATILK